MDPNAALEALIDVLCQGDANLAEDYANDLIDWLRKGGFPPDDPRA